MKAEVWRINNRIFSSNTYLCATSTPGECIIVDPGLDSESIDREITTLGLKPVGVFCTHGHFDHVGTSDYFKKKYGILLTLHRADLKLSKSSNFLLMACKVDARIVVPTVDVLAEDGFTVKVGGDVLRYVHVPGHTPGSCFIEFRGSMFTGDSLYKNAVGLVDFPGENPEMLKASLLKVWDQFPDTHHVYPGHGGSGAYGEIKQKNQRLRQFLGFESGVLARQSFEQELV